MQACTDLLIFISYPSCAIRHYFNFILYHCRIFYGVTRVFTHVMTGVTGLHGYLVVLGRLSYMVWKNFTEGSFAFGLRLLPASLSSSRF